MKELQIKSLTRVREHGEVLTAKKEIEAMLNLVKKESETIDSLFFEPACGDGNFLAVILERKLKTVLLNHKNNIDSYILSALSSIYGIDILYDNVELTISRLLKLTFEFYKKFFHIIPDENIQNNMKNILKKNILQCDFLNNFSQIQHYFKSIKFDVIISNPPYQKKDGGGTGDSAKPIYHLFVEQAKILNPHYIVMIIPSRWMKGGKGLKNFRQEMMSDLRLKELHDFENSKICFPDLHIDGGICYFLWDRDYNGKVNYFYQSLDGTVTISDRFLKSKYTNNIIRDYRQISIIEKVSSLAQKSFSSIVSSRNPYGFTSDFFNKSKEYSDINQSKKDKYCKIYGVKGKKGGAKRVNGFVLSCDIKKNIHLLYKYKLFFSKAYTTTSTIPPEIIVGFPNNICTETFLNIGNFDTINEAEHCLQYIKTKFFRALLFFNKHSLNISKKTFELIPLEDFSEEWSDIKLYKKYNLTENEINFIETLIKPMK